VTTLQFEKKFSEIFLSLAFLATMIVSSVPVSSMFRIVLLSSSVPLRRRLIIAIVFMGSDKIGLRRMPSLMPGYQWRHGKKQNAGDKNRRTLGSDCPTSDMNPAPFPHNRQFARVELWWRQSLVGILGRKQWSETGSKRVKQFSAELRTKFAHNFVRF